jgi:transcriptional regulator GlxA family with amidase domain
MQQPIHTPVQVVFVIPPGVHLLDITGPAHIFYEALSYGAPVKLHFCNVHANETVIESSSSLFLSQLTDFNTLSLNKGDLVFVPGLDAALLLDDHFLATTSKPFQQWMLAQHRKGITICSVCTGAYLLAEAGLLNNKACTTHWKYIERFTQRYPQAQVQQNRLFIQEDNLYTSAGVASGIDLALYLIEQLFGAHFAALVAKEVVVFLRRAPADPQLSVFMQYRNHMEDRVHQVQDILAQTLEKKLNIEQLAEQVHMSGRNLTRLFRKTTNISIGQYNDQLRIERAQQLLREGHTLQTTATLCGLKSTNQLRQLLKQKTA